MRDLTRLTALSLALFAFACNNEDKDGETDETDTNGGGTADCVLPSSTIPADGGTFFYKGVFVVTFESDAQAVSASFALDAGTLTAPEWDNGGRTATFTASGLTPSTGYTLTVTTDCADAFTYAFTTDAFGNPVADVTTLVDNVYELDLGSANIVKPPGVGSLLGTLLDSLGDTAILFKVKSATATSINFFGGIGEKDAAGTITQDRCTPTFALDDTVTGATVLFENPYFEVNAPDGITLDVAGLSITLGSVLLSGAFAADGSSLGGARLAGQADARDLVDALADLLDVGSADEVCSLLGGFGVACEPCSDGQNFCLTLDAQSIGAEKVEAVFDELPDSALDSSCE